MSGQYKALSVVSCRQEKLGLAAEHGFYYRAPGMAEWEARFGEADEHAGWKEIALPILQLYTESTDGSYVEAKDSALVRGIMSPRLQARAWGAKPSSPVHSSPNGGRDCTWRSSGRD